MKKPEYNYLPASIVNKIEQEFLKNIDIIFSEYLCFAFIFGGFGKGYATDTHDIDMFIVVNKDVPKEIISRFHKWYFSVHKQYKLPPDINYPGEIIPLSLLEEKMRFLVNRPFRKTIPTYYEYEAILWADALFENKIGIISKSPQMEELIQIATNVFTSWKKDIYQNYFSQLDKESLDALDLRRLFKLVGIKYLNKTPTAVEDEASLLFNF